MTQDEYGEINQGRRGPPHPKFDDDMTDTPDFPPLPEPAIARVYHDGQQTTVGLGCVYTAEQMHDYVLADRASRAAAQDAAIATGAPQPFGWWLETGSTKTNRMYFYWAEAHQAWEREGGAASEANATAVRECIEGWLLLDNVALVPGECVPLQTSAPVTYPILAAIFEAGYKSGKAS